MVLRLQFSSRFFKQIQLSIADHRGIVDENQLWIP